VIRSGLRLLAAFTPSAALEAVAIPVRYLSCDKWPTNVEANRKYRPDFDGVVMKGVGHFLMMEKPEEFNELLRKILATFAER